MSITDSWLKAQKGKERERTEVKSDRDGLGARVSPKGKITFQIRYRFQGKQSRMDVGTYPVTTLKQARADALQVLRHLEEGRDPRVERELLQRERRGGETIEGVIRAWYSAYCAKHKQRPDLILRSFEIHCFPAIGHLPAEKISTDQWLTQLEAVRDHSESIADRLLVNAKQAYRWAERRGLIQKNPIAHLTGKADLHLKKRAIDRVLSDAEVALVWEAVEKSRIAPKNRLFVKLTLLYGCRSGELRLSDMEHWDIEGRAWTVPADNHKMGRTTRRALKRPIIEPAERWVWEAAQLSPTAMKGKGPVFNNRDSMERMGRSSTLSIPYNLMQWIRRHKDVEVPHFSLHDLRRTMRTNIASLAPPHVAEIMIGHTLPGQWAVYDHYDYLPEQEAAYTAWWERIQRIVEHHAAMRAS